MKIEIETRFLDIDKEVLIKKLRSLGAQDFGEEKRSKNDSIPHFDQFEWSKTHSI